MQVAEMGVEQLGNKEITALKEFRHRLSDVIDQLDEFQTNDKNLLRWLKAREFNVAKAEEMLRKSLEWRDRNNVDKVLTRELPAYFFSELPHQVVGHDKEGCVICIVPLGKWDLKKTCEMGYREFYYQYVIQILERGVAYGKQKSLKNEMFSTQFVIIFDFDGFSLSQVLSQAAVGSMMECLKFFEGNYPEMMKAGYAVNAPKIFEILWTMIKPVMAQRTLSKVQIFGSNAEWRAALKKTIDPSQLPSNYGGTNNTHPFYLPEHGMDWPRRARPFLEKDFQTVMVSHGEKLCKAFELRPGMAISWNFRTDLHDIGFRVSLDGEALFPPAKCDSHLVTQDGCVEVRTAGKYILEFDNTYSRFRSKNLHYAIRIEDEDGNEEIVLD